MGTLFKNISLSSSGTLYRTFVLFVFTAVLILPAGQSAAAGKKLSVVDYYNLLRPGTIRHAGGKWVTESVVGEDMEVTVDLKNGYIAWRDPGTGGGTLSMEIALFTAGGRSILAVARKEFDGVSNSAELLFYEHKNGVMQRVTAGILPPMNIKTFLIRNYDRKACNDFSSLLDDAVVVYTLPRYGITMEATVDFTKILSRIQYGDEKSDAEKKRIRSFIESNFVQKIDLQWDVKSGKFNFKK